MYLSDLSDLDHDLYDISVRSILSRSWYTSCLFRSIWSASRSTLSISPIHLIYTMIYPYDLSYLDHDLPDLSVRSIWSRSWSILSICPIYLILNVIYPSDLCDLDHYPSNLSVQSIWSRSWSIWSICPIYIVYIMIYLIHLPIHLICIVIYVVYLSDLSDLYYDLSLRSIWSRSWSICSICPMYLI